MIFGLYDLYDVRFMVYMIYGTILEAIIEVMISDLTLYDLLGFSGLS